MGLSPFRCRVRPIALKRLGAVLRSAYRAGAGRDRVQHFQRQLFDMKTYRMPKYGILAAAIVILLTAWLGWRSLKSGQSFDPAGWNDPVQVRQGIRLTMADDLIARKLLKGRTRSEVIGLLGEPSNEGYFRKWDCVYWLGPERGYMSIDSEWLVIRFGTDDRVQEYRLARD